MALDRCWILINKASSPAAQATSQPRSFTSGKWAAEEDEATRFPVGFSTTLSDKSKHKGPLDVDEALRQDGSFVAQKYATRPNDSDMQSQLSAWVRALVLAGHDRSVSIPRIHLVARRFI